MKGLRVGLFGFGIVGEGIYEVLSQKPELSIEISKIVVKSHSKIRNAPSALFSTNPDEILKDDKIDTVVELIDDSKSAFEIVSKALQKGKAVISANKKMIAENHLELISISRRFKVPFLYEAAVCGSLPIIKNLEDSFRHDKIQSLQGIVNGSTNYILTTMDSLGVSFGDALSEAQERGFAESDPSLDIGGYDAAYKLKILTMHAFGSQVRFESILRKGIGSLTPIDFDFAKKNKAKIKLIAKCRRNIKGDLNQVSVLPSLTTRKCPLANTSNEFNGVLLETELTENQFFYGKGAGKTPTAAAVLSDICASADDFNYGYYKGCESLYANFEGDAKFSVSFPKTMSLDSSIFSDIDENVDVDESRIRVTGSIPLEKLHSSTLLSDENISLIEI